MPKFTGINIRHLEIILIKALDKDKDFLLDLRKKTMVTHLEKEGVYLSDQEHLARVNKNFEGAFIVEWSGMKVGLLKYLETDKILEILQLQIHPDYQGNGIGKVLIEKMIKRSKQEKKNLELKVLKQNPAKKLNERLGFTTYGEDTKEFFMQWTS